MARQKPSPEPVHRALEIGHGAGPITYRLMLNGTELPQNVHYVAIDTQKEFLKGLTPAMAVLARKGIKLTRTRLLQRPNTEVHRMDARELSFPDGHFDSVHLNNVLNSNNYGDAPDSQVECIIREARRVLKPGGHMVIVHDLTDARSDVLARVRAVGGFEEIGAGAEGLPAWFSKIPVNYRNIDGRSFAKWPPEVHVLRKRRV